MRISEYMTKLHENRKIYPNAHVRYLRITEAGFDGIHYIWRELYTLDEEDEWVILDAILEHITDYKATHGIQYPIFVDVLYENLKKYSKKQIYVVLFYLMLEGMIDYWPDNPDMKRRICRIESLVIRDSESLVPA